jgi:hypothetical protein
MIRIRYVDSVSDHWFVERVTTVSKDAEDEVATHGVHGMYTVAVLHRFWLRLLDGLFGAP